MSNLSGMLSVLVFEMRRRECSFWAWIAEDWAEVLCPSGRDFERRYAVTSGCRQRLIALGVPAESGIGP
ncbi:MAG: hypothetical protein KGJ86_17390 [Chloroflexota bacterium]|nr:hypothetical protein [Chloroflexota bacterium]